MKSARLSTTSPDASQRRTQHKGTSLRGDFQGLLRSLIGGICDNVGIRRRPLACIRVRMEVIGPVAGFVIL